LVSIALTSSASLPTLRRGSVDERVIRAVVQV
jgi:hypothetical protein